MSIEAVFTFCNGEWMKREDYTIVERATWFSEYDDDKIKDGTVKVIINGKYFVQQEKVRELGKNVFMTKSFITFKTTASTKRSSRINTIICDATIEHLINQKDATRKADGVLYIRCLFPNHEDKHPSALLYTRSGFFKCFACKKSSRQDKTIELLCAKYNFSVKNGILKR